MADKTLAMRVLEGQKVVYDTAVYPTTLRDAEEIANFLHVAADVVFKSLVVNPPTTTGRFSKPLLCVIPANRQLNLKKVAKVVGVKKVKMATYADAEKWTGLQIGGISPLALLNKGFIIYIEQRAQQQDNICISAGQRGTQIIVSAQALARVTRAKWVDVT